MVLPGKKLFTKFKISRVMKVYFGFGSLDDSLNVYIQKGITNILDVGHMFIALVTQMKIWD